MYKYFKNAVIRNSLFTLYYFYLTLELLEMFMRTTNDDVFTAYYSQ